MNGPSQNSGDLPLGWASTRIRDIVVEKVAQYGPKSKSFFSYIDISSIDNSAKRIMNVKKLAASAAPSRAKQNVSCGDVLVSMTRPNLNAVALVPDSLDGEVASTGFDVLRSLHVDPRWIFLIVRTRAFIDTMSEKVQGALYPAVRPRDIREYERHRLRPFSFRCIPVSRIIEQFVESLFSYVIALPHCAQDSRFTAFVLADERRDVVVYRNGSRVINDLVVLDLKGGEPHRFP